MRYLKPLCSHPKPHGIFSKYIYQNHCATLQPANLTPRNPSFIEKATRLLLDVLWSVETSDGDGYIYCVIDIKALQKRIWLFRLMRYATAASVTSTKAMTESAGGAVAVLSWRNSPYPYSLNWLDEFDDPQLARQLYTEAFPLVDITIVPDDEIMQHRRIALLELIQKHIRDRDLIGMVDRITTLLVRGFTNDSQLRKHCFIICCNAAIPPVSPVLLRRLPNVHHYKRRD